MFEANQYIGGHTNTIEVELNGECHAVDTGFIVFNDRTYPNFTRILNELHIQSQPTQMSFSMKCHRSGLEYRGADLNGFFAQRRNLLNPRFYRLLKDILRFNRACLSLMKSGDEEMTVSEYMTRGKYSNEFRHQYFLPMGSAIWSCPPGTFEQFPIRFIVDFYHNHGILAIKDIPQWQVVCGGSKRYVEAIIKGFKKSIRTNTPVVSLVRKKDYVEVCPRGHSPEQFDHVIFACHSDQALQILGEDTTSAEHELLTAFPYENNVAQLHTDVSVLPHNRRAWACWNYFVPDAESAKATVTYNMNLLQNLKSRNTFSVTLNGEDRVDPGKVIRRINYAHPVFTSGRAAAQRRHAEVINQRRTSFCGAYWGNGFHEDGVTSSLKVCRALNGTNETWKAASMKVGSDISEGNLLNTDS